MTNKPQWKEKYYPFMRDLIGSTDEALDENDIEKLSAFISQVDQESLQRGREEMKQEAMKLLEDDDYPTSREGKFSHVRSLISHL